jgi:hypothetical protein
MVMALLCAIPMCNGIKSKESLWVGGECEYKSYKGHAKIISITPKKESDPSKDEYEIKFLFFPEQEIKESFAQVEGKEFLLLISDAYSPGRKFIEKHDIKVGKIFHCTLRVIVKGTCPPMIFEFPFTEENQKE